MNQSIKTTVLTTSDIGKVQGSTEQYYVLNGLSEDHDVHVYAPMDPEIAGVSYHHLPSERCIPALIWYNFVVFPVLLYHALSVRPDVFYSYKGFHLLPLVVSRLSGAEWICDLRTAPTEQERERSKHEGRDTVFNRLYHDVVDVFYRTALPRAASVISLSEELTNQLIDQYDVRQENIVLVPLAVDTTSFNPERFADAETDRIDFVYLGSVRLYRGIETCIEAFADSQLCADYRFHIIGDGPDDEIRVLKDLVTERRLDDHVIWHGFIDHERVPELLATMDIAISPLPDHERYMVMSPAKVYEYLAMGLPVICSDLPAHRRLVQPDSTGFFFQPGSTEDLHRAVRRAVDTPRQELDSMSTRARATAERHSWESRIRTVTTCIRDVVTSESERGPAGEP